MKYFVLALFVGLIVDASAQTGKGSFMIGGSLKASRNSSEYNSYDPDLGVVTVQKTVSTQFNVSPTVGYFFVKNLMTGVQFDYSTSKTKGLNSKSSYVALGPVVRYYIPFGKFAFFPEVAAQYQRQSSTGLNIDPNTGASTKVTQHQGIARYKVGAGIAWFVSPNIGIEVFSLIRLVGPTSTISQIVIISISTSASNSTFPGKPVLAIVLDKRISLSFTVDRHGVSLIARSIAVVNQRCRSVCGNGDLP